MLHARQHNCGQADLCKPLFSHPHNSSRPAGRERCAHSRPAATQEGLGVHLRSLLYQHAHQRQQNLGLNTFLLLPQCLLLCCPPTPRRASAQHLLTDECAAVAPGSAVLPCWVGAVQQPSGSGSKHCQERMHHHWPPCFICCLCSSLCICPLPFVLASCASKLLCSLQCPFQFT